MGILSILGIIATLVPTILQNAGVIGSGTTNLITSLLGPVENLVINLKAGTSKTQDTLAVLGSLMGILTVLQAQTNLPADKLAEIKALLADVNAALTEYVQSGKGIDLSVLTPIAPVA